MRVNVGRMVRIVALLAALSLVGVVPAQPVTVAYAASLIKPMEGPIAQTLLREEHLQFLGEAKGSTALAHLISDGLRHPDVFISADSSLYPGLRPFGRADLVVAYAPSSRFAAQFDAAAHGKLDLAALLRTPGLRIGRTDPQVDPKGAKTLSALAALGVSPGGDEQTFPEEDLLVRTETGQVDCGFFYTTETHTADLKVVVLPKGIGSRPGIAVEYAIVVVPGAAHPAAAHRLVDFLLQGEGRHLLEDAGLHYL